MSIIKWQPISDLMAIQDRLNRIFEEEFGKDFTSRGLSMSAWHPFTDVFETKDTLVFKMELPGFKKEDIQIEFKNQTLIVKGERKQDEEIKKENYHRMERNYGLFQRYFEIPTSIDSQKINATLKEGILELVLPKKEEAKPKAIPITVK